MQIFFENEAEGSLEDDEIDMEVVNSLSSLIHLEVRITLSFKGGKFLMKNFSQINNKRYANN